MKLFGVFVALLLNFPGAGLAANLADLVTEHSAQIIELRHQIHNNPELGNREVETAQLVAAHLTELGIEVRTEVAHTGVVGVLRGGQPGPVVAMRADMDALPVTEDTDLAFKSTKRGVYKDKEVGIAHACGHDIHTAVLLGTASVLAGMRDSLPGTVKFIFQPAEEGPPVGEEGGARLMLAEGVFEEDRPSAIFALHSHPEMPVGQVGVTSGPAFASSDHFLIKLKGRQSHGAYPHKSIDPIVMAADVVQMLQTIRSRNLDPSVPGVVTVGLIRGGERNNIIPSQVEMEGTVRTYSEDVRTLIQARMEAILFGVTSAHGGSFEFDYRAYAPPTINDPTLYTWARASLMDALGPEHVVERPPVMGAEDFAYFAREVPGFYFRLGVLKEGTVSGGLHTPTMRADDGAIPVGIHAMSKLALNYLRKPPKLSPQD